MKKILIIEDDQIVANVYSNKLSVENFKVETAPDGEAGLAAAQTFKPDLILLDLMMPGIDGVEVMKRLRAQAEFEKTPIVVFSNTYLSSTIKEAWKAGANKCFSKTSCTPKQILEAVRSLLEAPTASPGTVPKLKMAGAPTDDEAAPTETKTSEMLAAENFPAVEFGRQFPAQLNALRQTNQALARSTTEAGRSALLAELSAQVHGLVGGAGVAGLASFARVADALEALLKELHARPASLNQSTLRTTANAIDFLESLFRNGKALDAKKTFSAEILVVDDELLSRRAVTHALEKAKLHATDLEDPMAALKLVSENSYDLIILDVDMPGMNGFELCAKLRGLSLNKKTPVIFVTALNDFDARANSTMAGANDFIAKPFLFIELALKALIFIHRARLEAAKF
ncbi:MAG: hypothetical protein RL380_667 [Verrucomicrobiota bacterium]|jgi:DNA-binding response OmpR family regulator